MALSLSFRRRFTVSMAAWIIGFVMFFPILWTGLAAFKTEADAYDMAKTLFISAWTLENFAEVQSRSDVILYLRNTIIIALFSSLLGLVFAIPAAWSMTFAPKSEPSIRLSGFAWLGIILAAGSVDFAILYSHDWLVGSPLMGIMLILIILIPAVLWVITRETKSSLLWILSTKMMPPAGALIPIFLIFGRNGLVFREWGDTMDWRNYNLFDSFWGMIPLMMLLNLPIMIWMLYTYFKEIPAEILEAARMDGAKLWDELLLVLTPMALPGIASTVLLSFILAWNEAFWTLSLTTKYAAPVSFLISEYSNPQGQFWAKLSAASLLAIAPILILGWFSQKQLVRGLTFGAVK